MEQALGSSHSAKGGASTVLLRRIVTARATAQQLLVTRLVIHPAIWGMITMLFTHTARHIGGICDRPLR